MLDSYLPTFFLTVLYLLSIWLGNKYMKNRPALSLRGVLTLYNLGITLLSVYMLVEVSVCVAELVAGEAARGRAELVAAGGRGGGARASRAGLPLQSTLALSTAL